MSDCCSVNVKPGVAPAAMPCPVNGWRSKQVDTLTIKSLVHKLPFAMPDTQYYFCDSPAVKSCISASTRKRRGFVGKT